MGSGSDGGVGSDGTRITETHLRFSGTGCVGGYKVGHFISASQKTAVLPVMPISFPSAKKGLREMCIIPLPTFIPDSTPFLESSVDRASHLHIHIWGLPIPSQVSDGLPHKRAVRSHAEPQDHSAYLRPQKEGVSFLDKAQVGVRHQVSVKSKTSRAV